MFTIDNKNISLNRGDEINLRLSLKEDESFQVGDVIRFTIVKKNDYSTIIFRKEFTVSDAANYFDIELTSDETKLGDILKTGTRVYWYEIELNGKITLIGADKDGDKLFTLYPEAEEQASI